ncbi:hydantoinase/oxoprolinase family protein [Actinospongicola halichondriae]|uniref:hydantoinase/oxoprolinase family protein n=1 Tax=Actinospongicola halichondriae TaxID=3236844 RepID=UPI003D40BBE6
MRISVDIGGTFTDMVVEYDGRLALYKSPTVPEDPARGILDVLDLAAADLDMPSHELLDGTDLFMHATTRGLNAVLTGTAARTAFLTTAGHPDVLLLREGGRTDPFDHTVEYPSPYVPRSLTFEVVGRLSSSGEELVPVDPTGLRSTCREIATAGVEAIGVCLLWSTVNPSHELAVGDVLAQELPGLPVTLSHQLNPSLREFRRASSACIDASLKPLMTEYIDGLSRRLTDGGFAGRFLMVTSIGGVLDAEEVAAAPIHSINSGPSMAPVAGRRYAQAEAPAEAVIVADAGGTTYDVTLVRRGHIPWTRSAWIGGKQKGHMSGLPSIDVKSVGAGGGSIAWIDDGGLLHVGPQSAGANPGPACYGNGGTEATVTDAALVLGYLDPEAFSAGHLRLDPGAAAAAIERSVAGPLALDLFAGAEAIMALTTEQMVRAIEEIALEQGIDPRSAVLVGGGGAAGLNAVSVAQRLGSPQLLIPEVGAALSAAGALMSDLLGSYSLTLPATSDRFDFEAVNDALAGLDKQAREFAARARTPTEEVHIEFYAEAHYPQQIWELEVVLPKPQFASPADVDGLVQAFHRIHDEVLGITDPDSGVEIVGWGVRVRCPLRNDADRAFTGSGVTSALRSQREVHFPGLGVVDTPVLPLGSIGAGESIEGPVLVESPCTTVVIPSGASCGRGPSGSLVVVPEVSVKVSGR